MQNHFSLHEVAVDTTAIRANASALIHGAPANTVIADVRADGYGHGAVEAARAAVAAGAGWLGVSSEAEGRELLDSGIEARFLSVAGRLTEGIPDRAESPTVFLSAAELYGLVADDRTKPCMRVSARVVAVKEIGRGEGVSYGHTYRASGPTRLALVAIGYANGLDRYASNTASMWLHGKPRLIAGRVAMNAAVIELGDDLAEVGDVAVLFGNPADGEPAVWDWARALGKNADEIAAALGEHLPRRYT